MDLVNLAQRIKTLRLRQKMTVAQLAEKSDLSRGFISRLENFRVTASLKALERIAAALGVSLVDLFQDGACAPEYVFGRIDEGELIDRNQGKRSGMSYFSLAYRKSDRQLNPFLLEYRTPEVPRAMLAHESDEFFIVLDGFLNFYIGDLVVPHPMGPGDTVYLSKNLPHCARLAENCSYAKALTVYSA